MFTRYIEKHGRCAGVCVCVLFFHLFWRHSHGSRRGVYFTLQCIAGALRLCYAPTGPNIPYNPNTAEPKNSDLGWIAKPPREGEARVPPMFEKDLVAGDGPILGKGAYGVTRLSKSSFTGEYYAVSGKAVVLATKIRGAVEHQHPPGPPVGWLLLEPIRRLYSTLEVLKHWGFALSGSKAISYNAVEFQNQICVFCCLVMGVRTTFNMFLRVGPHWSPLLWNWTKIMAKVQQILLFSLFDWKIRRSTAPWVPYLLLDCVGLALFPLIFARLSWRDQPSLSLEAAA